MKAKLFSGRRHKAKGAGKGDRIRCLSISDEEYGENFDRIFRKPNRKGRGR